MEDIAEAVTLPKLQKICRKKGIDPKGSKLDLLKRIMHVEREPSITSSNVSQVTAHMESVETTVTVSDTAEPGKVEEMLKRSTIPGMPPTTIEDNAPVPPKPLHVTEAAGGETATHQE